MKNLLVVNDHPASCATITSLMSSLGYVVKSTQCPLKAITLLDQYFPDLFIIHLIFSHITSDEFALEIRQLAEYRKTPILLVTADGGDDLHSQAEPVHFIAVKANQDDWHTALQTVFAD